MVLPHALLTVAHFNFVLVKAQCAERNVTMTHRHTQERDQEDGQQRSRKDRRNGQRRSGAVLTGGLEVLKDLEVVVQAAPAPRTLVEIAQGMQPYTTFACFAFEGQGATLFLKDAGLIFEHQVTDKFGEVYRVIEAQDRGLNGVFVKVPELQSYAEQGWEAYLPRAETKLPAELENCRASVITALLQAIKADGGHKGVMNIIESLRTAAKLRETMVNGSQDLLAMFDKTRINRFVVEIGGKIMVFRSGSFDAPTWKGQVKSLRQVFGVKLMEAPAGAPDNAYKVGTYVLLEHLFCTKPPSSEVGALMRDLRGLFEAAGLTDKVKAKVIELGGTIPEAEPQGEAEVADSVAHVPELMH